MAIRNDFTIDWSVSPRIITIDAPSTSCSMQDLYDTLRWLEFQPSAMEDGSIVDASGKEPLDDAGTKVGITISLKNATVGFEARADWTQCTLDGGNLVAYDSIGSIINPINPTAFINITRTSSSSATLQEQEALQYSSFGGVVTVDAINGVEGRAFPLGTIEYPTKKVSDAVLICAEKGFTTISVIGSIALIAGDDVRGLKLVGTSHIHSVLDVGYDAQCQDTQFCCFDITGILDGGSEISECIVRDLVYFNGSISDSAIAGVVTLAGNEDAHFKSCYMYDFDFPAILDCGGFGQNAIFSQFSAKLKVQNLTGASTIGIGLASGGIVIDSTCTAGKIICNGNGSVDKSAKGDNCNVIDRLVSGRQISNISRQIAFIADHHTSSGNEFFWNPHSGNDDWDGEDSDTAFRTFARAQDACQNANHDTIYIVPDDPSGVTVITEDINVTKDYLFIRGVGRDLITTGKLTTTARGTEFSGFRVQYTGLGNALHSTGAFTFLNNLWFEECTSGALFEKSHPIVHNTKFYKSVGYAMRFQGDTYAGEIKNVSASGGQDNGIEVDVYAGVGGIKMWDTVVVGNSGYGITLGANTSKFISKSGNVVVDNALGDFDDNGTDSVLNVENTASSKEDVENATCEASIDYEKVRSYVWKHIKV